MNYDYDDINEKEERCLCDEINLQGRKIVLVNMDDKCQVDRLIREGIFLDTGDFLLFAGSSLEYYGEDWEFASFDHQVLFDFAY